MLRTLTRAIIEAMLRILAAFPAGVGKAMPRWVARQRHLPVQADDLGPIFAAFEMPRPPRPRRLKPPDRSVVKGRRPG